MGLFIILGLTFLAGQFNLLPWAILPLALVFLVYLFQPQINYWWINRQPVGLDDEVIQMISKVNPIYNELSAERKNEFLKRVELYIHGMEFNAKSMENDRELPYDVKNLIAQIPITMMWNSTDKLFKHFERIIVYKHPFGTPKHRFLHTSETDIEDGVIIFCLEHAEAAFKKPRLYYNVAWHSYADAYIKYHPNKNYPLLTQDVWNQIENISNFSQEGLKGVIGFNALDPMVVLITLYFTHREAFKEREVDLFREMAFLFE